jgi:tRNA A37 threonylcarbamoyltransferase TsaD
LEINKTVIVASSWSSIFTLPTLMMNGQTQIKFIVMGFSAECRVSFSGLATSCLSEIVSHTALAETLNGT